MTFAPDQLPSILAGHTKWLRGDARGARANLSGAVLSGANLRSAVLSGAVLRSAVLSGANLRSANLSGAVLRSADLRNADLRNANLRSANLRSAVLTGADLSGADLRSAVLSGAVLTGAVLTGANLSGADLSGADLRSAVLSGAVLTGAVLTGAVLSGADLRSANLSGADLRNATGSNLAIAQTRILPEGDLIGYKSCEGGVIVKLRIPEAAKRSHAFGRKCRAEYATVLEITGPKGGKRDVANSKHEPSFTYTVGETVRPRLPFSDNWAEECESGIHFFVTRLEAENY